MMGGCISHIVAGSGLKQQPTAAELYILIQLCFHLSIVVLFVSSSVMLTADLHIYGDVCLGWPKNQKLYFVFVCYFNRK